MKTTMRETTVWYYIVREKKEFLTDEGLFDLTKLNGLYVTNIRNIIKLWLKDSYKSVIQLNSKLGKGKDYLGKILRQNSSTPLKLLLSIKNSLNIQVEDDDLFRLLIKNKCKFFVWRSGGNSIPINIPLLPENITHIAKFLYPLQKTKVYISRKVTISILNKIKKAFDVKIFNEGKYNRIIRSITLNKFLRTFYIYEKEFKFEFPLSNIIPRIGKRIDLVKGVILPLIQSDGSVHENKSNFTWEYDSIPDNKELHNIFADAFYFVFNRYPSTFLEPRQNGKLIRTTFILSKNESQKLIKMCGSTKKSPAKSKSQKSRDYLKEIQPNLDYLKDANLSTKITAIRLWFCAEGSISVNRPKKNNVIRPKLHLACANPTLAKQLQSLCTDLGLVMNIEYTKDKTWSGIVGLYSTSIETVKNFIRIGSFLPKVYISDISKYYQGLEKQKVQSAILKYRELEKEEKFSRSLPIRKVHKQIREIVNKEINAK